MRRGLTIVSLMLLLILAACSGRSAPPDPLPAKPAPQSELEDRGQKGAMAALKAYVEARQALDLVRAYALLTPSAKAAYSAEEFIAALKEVQGYAYESLIMETPEKDMVRGYAENLVIVGARPYKYARYGFTLRYEEGRWGLALGTGLRVQAVKAFETGKFEEDLLITERWLAIDPFAWEAHVERFYVYKDTGRHEDALEAWNRALELAAPEDHPELYATLANLYLLNKQGDELIATAQKALDSAAQLGQEQTDRYSIPWRATQMAHLAFGHRYRGDLKQALLAYQQAKGLDPANATVERFERTLLTP